VRLRPGFYFITDSTLTCAGVIADVRLALAAGVSVVQYREKTAPADQCRREAREIQALCRAAGVPFLVNDLVELAAEIGSDGAHVGQQDLGLAAARAILGPAATIGVSVATAEEARTAQAGGADYLAVSPVFATATKLDAGLGVGLAGIAAIRAVTDLPLAAIGGIGPANVRDVRRAGADLICAISASLAGGTVDENIRKLMELGRD
jgi:thiamine-phosphate pyrophosphorylase